MTYVYAMGTYRIVYAFTPLELADLIIIVVLLIKIIYKREL